MKRLRWSNANYQGPKYLGLSGIGLSRGIGFAASAGFLLLGYDQGVMGSLLSLPSFLENFPQLDPDRNGGAGATSGASTLQGLTVALYEIGCLMGALVCLAVGDKYGRVAMIIWGTIIMVIGAVVQTASYDLTQFIIARVITGVGNGMHTATIPMWQSECAPPHKRGMLLMVEGFFITAGIAMAYWVDFAFYWLDPASRFAEGEYNPADFPARSAAWRIPIAWQILLCIPTFATYWMPESPRWQMLRSRKDDARIVLASLEELNVDDPEIDRQLDEIQESLDLTTSGGVRDIFTQGSERNFHRTVLGFTVQMLQQMSGINLITYYAPFILERYIGLSPLLARLIGAANGTEYFLISIVAVWTIERFGRRKLMIFGASGMCASMVILSVTTSPAVLRPDASGEATNKAPSYVAVVMLFMFNSFFAIGWLGMGWLYPAEITPLRVRAAATGISTSSNWLFNAIVVLITPIAFERIDNHTYTLFGAINFCILVATFFVFPETAGRSLEEMSEIFSQASYLNPYDVVRIEQKTPRRYDKKGRPITRTTSRDENVGGDLGGGYGLEAGETITQEKARAESRTSSAE